LLLALIAAPALLAQATDPGASAAAAGAEPWRLAIDLEGGGKAGSASVGMQIVVVMTLLSIAPSLLLLMTSFTRIVIVLGFVRTAIGVPSAPANRSSPVSRCFSPSSSWGRPCKSPTTKA
jgi:flagellar biosynthetic protein FliP